MIMRRRKHTTIVAASFAIGLAPVACADLISPGFDLFSSNDTDGNSLGAAVDLSMFGLGIVALKGVPFNFGPFGLGVGIDTIVQRLQGINPFDPPNGVGIVDIELVALHLVSVKPIKINGQLFDLHTTVNKDGIIDGLPQPDPLPPSLGSMEIRHETDGGGTFDSMFGALGDAALVPDDLEHLLVRGGGVTANAFLTPAGKMDIVNSFVADRVILWSQRSTWEHSVFQDFFVTGIEHNCPFPECHPVRPVPSPATLALLSLGAIASGRRRRRARCE